MPKLHFSKEEISHFFYMALLVIAGILILLIIVGTIIGLTRPVNAEPLINFGSPPQTMQPAIQGNDIRIYTGLGRLRIPLVNSSTLILSIVFPYSADDVTFTEELAAKVGDLRTIATDYFSSLPVRDLIQIDEETAKREILRSFNANLRLGNIDVIYFNDMMIIDAL
jgi:flagellar basal body-associated protein FliL